jgi:hypothetical protein
MKKPGLFILPFIAVLIGTLGSAIGSSFPEARWFISLGWAAAAIIIIMWVTLDLEGFKAVFARKGTKYGASSGAVVILGMAVIVGLSVVTSLPRFNKSVDLSRDKTNTLSDQSFKIIDTIKQAKTKINITTFFVDE